MANKTRWLKISALIILPIILFWVLWVQRSWQPRTLQIGESSFEFSFTQDGQRLKVARSRPWQNAVREVQFWDVATRTVQKTIPDARLKLSISALSPNETRVVGMASMRTLKVWNVSTGKLERTITKPKGWETITLEFSPDSKIWAESRSFNNSYAHYPNTIFLWEASSGRLLRTLNTGRNTVTWFSFTPDGKTLISYGISAVQAWDVASGSQLWKSIDRGLQSFRSPLSSDGRILASGNSFSNSFGSQPVISLWDVRTGKRQRKLTDKWTSGKWSRGSLISGTAFSPDDKIFAAAGYDPDGCPPQSPGAGCTLSTRGVPVLGEVHLWDTQTGKPLRTLTNKGKPFGSVAFSADGELLAAGSEGEILIWEVATGKLLRTLGGNRKTAHQLCFSPDGNTLAAGSFRDQADFKGDSIIQLFRVR